MAEETLVTVERVTRRFGQRRVVADISFSVSRGEVLGFLGPNGAGKSTTMNMISGVMALSSGSIRIAGHDIVEAPVQAKQYLGFLPEKPPIYPELTVDEYLAQHGAAFFEDLVLGTRLLRTQVEAALAELVAWGLVNADSFTGLRGFWRQDRAVVESMGPIYDRSQEHLGASDLGILRFRRLFLGASKAYEEQGTLPPGLDPKTHRVRAVAALLPENAPWQDAISKLAASERWVPGP